MIFPITDQNLEVCWAQCRNQKNCTWFSYSQSQELCFLMNDCPEKNDESGWVSYNSDCYDPESKKFCLVNYIKYFEFHVLVQCTLMF